MVHERPRRSATGGNRRPRHQQAVRTTARPRRIDVRAWNALVATLIVSSVALMGQVARAEIDPVIPGTELAYASASALGVEADREALFEPATPVRQGGDLTDATDSPVERTVTRWSSAPVRPTVWY